MSPEEILDRLYYGEDSLVPDRPLKSAVPLINLHNTCFLNVVLQALFHTAPLANVFLLLTSTHEADIREHLEDPRIYVLLYFIKMNHVIWTENSTAPIRPRAFIQQLREYLPNYEYGSQHDAQETLIWLLDTFHECLSREVEFIYEVEGDSDRLIDKMRIEATKQWAQHYRRTSIARGDVGSDDGERYGSRDENRGENRDKAGTQSTHSLKSSYSPILDIFGGQYLERFNCGNDDCGHITSKYESFLSSELQIQDSSETQTIENALQRHCELERLEEGNEWRCEKCNKLTLPLRRSSFWLLPKQCLILSLKRFTHEFKNGRYQSRKINRMIEYDPEEPLDMDPYVSNGLSDTIYRLYAIICHSGSLDCGHYYMFGRDSEGAWWYFNDHVAAPVHDTSRLVTADAYILFYQLVKET